MYPVDNLFFLVLLFVPATFFIIFNRYFRLTPLVEKDETARLSSALLFGFVVFSINSYVFAPLYSEFIEQVTVFENSPLLSEMVIYSIITSSICCCLFVWVLKPVFILITNFLNYCYGRPLETENSETWNDIFESKRFVDINDDCIVTIEKDNIKSTGFICLNSSPVAENKTILIKYSSEIAAYFENDVNLTDEEKIFNKINYEYVDLTNGFKITFYDNTKYKQHNQK